MFFLSLVFTNSLWIQILRDEYKTPLDKSEWTEGFKTFIQKCGWENLKAEGVDFFARTNSTAAKKAQSQHYCHE